MTAVPMPPAAEHAPLSVLNPFASGIRTMIVCSCEWMPAKPPDRASTRDNAHAAHRRDLSLPPADYSATVFGEGPWAGMTWDAWYAAHKDDGVDPYTGRPRDGRFAWAEAEVGQARR